jgi:hypothetical protein
MSNRFTDLISATPVTVTRTAPTADQIAATGRALGEGTHTITKAQQRRWFGTVIASDDLIEWNGTAFVVDGVSYSPMAIVSERENAV